ncbi:hypothetical protein AB0L33_30370 [Streptomyces sp. NPDC052299]|uniref:hypothetical protein n=1 Tax=Streptomyces sp. NPDC052299 TaxID=3155054 RepID=UPI0034208519
MTTLRPHLGLLLAAVPLAAATVAAALRAGHWRLYADRHRIELRPQPRRSCPDCQGAGGWWVDGANPEMEACHCWADRRAFHAWLLPAPGWNQPPF